MFLYVKTGWTSAGACAVFFHRKAKESNRFCGKETTVRFTDDFPSDRVFRRGRRAHYRVGENAMKKHFSLILVLTAVALCAMWTCGGFFGNNALAEPGSSSAGYTVDFSFQGQTYSVRGQSSCALDSIFYRLGIEGEIGEARLDLSAGEDIDGALDLTREAGGWYLTSRVPFDSAYTLTADVAGETVSVRVTDSNPEAQNASLLKKYGRIPVTLIWEDSDNQDRSRPASVTLGLFKEGAQASASQLTLSDEDNWTDSFYAQTEDENGNPVPYTVNVIGAADEKGNALSASGASFNTGFQNDYLVSCVLTQDKGLVVTASYEPEKTSYSLIKVWRDDSDRDGVRPESTTVQLYADGEPCGDAAVLRGGSTELRWAYTFENLDRYQDGQEITYTVRETALEGLTWQGGAAAGWYQGNNRVYTSWYDRGSKLVEGQNQIVDQHEPEIVTVVAGKRWADKDNQDGVRPTSITFTLYADGRIVPENDSCVTITLDGEPDTGLKVLDRGEKAAWRAYFTDLPRFRDGGVPIVYTVKETAMKTGSDRWVSIDGGKTWKSEISKNPYISSGLASAENNYLITNSHQPGDVTAAVAIRWDDSENEAGKRPAELAITLLGNGEAVESFTLNEENGWTAVRADLEPFDGEEKVEYTWQAAEPLNYREPEDSRTVTADQNGTRVTTITYRYESATVQPSAVVVWVEDGAPAGVRPDQVNIRLLADGELVEEAALSEGEDGWRHTFNELSRYNTEGERVVFSVTEDEVPGYRTEITGDADQGFVITNTYYLANGSVRLSARKLVSGEAPTERDETFSFELYIAEVDEAAMKLVNAGEYPMAMVNNSGSSVLFPEISYDVSEAGRTYWFLASEVVPEGSVNYVYDFTRYVAGVTLTDNGDGTLNTQVAWYRLDEATKALTAAPEGAVFNNEREDPDSLSITMTVVGNRTSRHFDFSLIFKDENGQPLTGEYPYLIQDGDGKVLEEGTFNLDNGAITPKGTDGGVIFRLADGEMIVVNYLPIGSTYSVKTKNTKAYITSTQENGQTNQVSGDIVEGGAHVDYINTEITTDFTVTKKWEGGDPGWSISLTLGTVDEGYTGRGTMTNGDFISLYPQPAYTREGNKYIFKDLPKYDENDNIIVYAAKEAPIANYGLIKYRSTNSNVSAYVLDGGTITNSKSATFRVQKKWTGVKEDEELPPITLALWCIKDPTTGESEFVRATSVSLKDGEYYTFNGLTEGYTYYVMEDPVKGFATSYDNGANSDVTKYAENMGTIINHKLPKTGDNDPVGLWTMMVLTGLTGLIGLTALAVLRVRRKQEG